MRLIQNQIDEKAISRSKGKIAFFVIVFSSINILLIMDKGDEK
jgi:hypothetical protein